MITIWQETEIYFPPGSYSIQKLSDEKLLLNFYLPIIGTYYCKLVCDYADEGFNSADDKFNFALQATNFSFNPEYSRLKCYHLSWETRWCEGRNIGYVNGFLTFFSNAQFDFPTPFLVPGSRAPPFDPDHDRIVNEPLVSQHVPGLKRIRGVSILYGLFHNSQMLWHTIYDNLIPIHAFTKHLGRNKTIFIRSMFDIPFKPLYKGICRGIRNLETLPNSYFEYLILGCEKYEKNPSPLRQYDESYSFEYAFKSSDAEGLRDGVLRAMNVSTKNVGLKNSPLAILIERRPGNGARQLLNADEVFASLRARCPFCEARRLDLDAMELGEQLDLFSRSSVVVGVHGSGLANVAWMSPSRPNHTTHLVELLPYNYSCRDWFATAASIAGVRYHRVMADPPGDADGRLRRCWADPSQCATRACHDRLRDQPLAVSAEQLEAVLEPIARELKSTVAVNEFAVASRGMRSFAEDVDVEVL